MTEEYSIFRRFSDIEQVNELKIALNEQGIDTIVDDNSPPVDVTFTGGGAINNKIEVRIKQSDFDKAELILEKIAETQLSDIDTSYYLFEFTNEELFDILLKYDEWNEFDYALAQKILKDRGKSVDKELLESLKKQRLEELAKPEGNQRPWIIGGYFFAFMGGFLGLVIGYLLFTSKKTLPNGEKVFSYAKKDRIQGKYIFYIGLVVFPTLLLLEVFG